MEALHAEMAVLRERMAAAEERLTRLTITRETVQSLLEDAPYEDALPKGNVVEEGGLIPGQRPAPEPEPAELRPEPQVDPASAPQPQPMPRPRPMQKPKAKAKHPKRTPSVGIHLDEAVDRMLVILTTVGREMKVRDIAVAIGENTEDRRIETTRSRLKALAKQGKVVEGHPGWFRIAPARPALEPAPVAASEYVHGGVVAMK
ncbi:hypothetical protein C7C46_10015 [Streptomyces tateyamensis]|uniref:Uncharacterized protein n=1 Tax=Streptomyces tateyamensis TaxID=565073 RepID=A0A2V4NCZ5_9ACTN|nr:hypothetical protein [Streptomyces tateyamensis]PYC82681.1 hypothetical protein C7C46_10015 [Streptomyces tateyamensis]